MHARLGRRALRLLIALLTVAGLVGVAGPAWAGPPDHHGGEARYLALGDSVPFGYRGGQLPQVYQHPQLFVGYPEIVAHDFGVRVLNASCPGETTASFMDATAQSNGCENSLGSDTGYRDLYPLHVQYPGSQLDYAVKTLEHDHSIRLVTLMLGANDGFLCQKTPPQSYCADLFAHLTANLNTILGDLRSEGHYDGRIVVVTYYALDYNNAESVGGSQLLNAALEAAAQANGALVADGFGAFQTLAEAAGGSSIAAGLVLPNDVHPTLLGQLLLARAVEQAVGH